MAETTPLLPLPRADRPPHDPSEFLHLCHSPWSSLVQKAAVAVRAIIAAYLSVAFALEMFHGINYTQRGKQFAFEASNISLAIQIVYYWITTSWALQDFFAPYCRLPPEEQANGGFLAQLQANFSAPTSADTSPKRHLAFSTLYTASVTFPFVISIAYWLVLYPLEPAPSSGSGALQNLLRISITVLNSVIALVEIMVLSSVRKQEDLANQVAGVIAIYLLYALWTVFGYCVSGEYVYKYFDPDYAGWRGVATTDIVILSLTVVVFFAERGLQKIREMVVLKVGSDG